jgi:hypothetical protein
MLFAKCQQVDYTFFSLCISFLSQKARIAGVAAVFVRQLQGNSR